MTYHGERHSAVGNEVVIETRKVGTAAVLELNGRVYVDAERVAALDMIQDLLALLLQELLLRSQVLDDGSRILNASQGGDVVQRRAARQCARGRIGEERCIGVAQAHCARDMCVENYVRGYGCEGGCGAVGRCCVCTAGEMCGDRSM